MTTAGRVSTPGGGAGSRVADGATAGGVVVSPAGATGVLPPGASSATRCRWCERPSAGLADPQHAPCVAAAQRMDRDLLAARDAASTTDLLHTEW